MLFHASRRCIAIAAGSLLWLGAEASGQSELFPIDQVLASDGAAFDSFGTSVSVSGDVAVIGAHFDDDNGGNSGSAYVFRFNGSTWVQEQKLLPSDGAAGDQFGGSVALSDDVAVIGAHFDDDNGSASGSAYVFRFNGASWVQEQKLLPSDGAASDFFGFSVSASGDVAVVAADGDDDNGMEDSGAAYVFRFNGTSWAQEQKLLASDGAEFDEFGNSVAVDGDVAVVGADGNFEEGNGIGSAYVFRFNGSSWVQEQKLLASDGEAGNFFGASVSVSGDVAVVGAPGAFNRGAAYVYRFNGSSWFEQQDLQADDGASSDNFGISVSVRGEVAVVGASGAGAAYVFRSNDSPWVQEQKLPQFGGSGSFGASVSLSGDVAVVGAPFTNDNGTNSGSAHVLDLRALRISADCNGNGIPDAFDVLDGAAADCNDNFIPDSCDIASGYSMDVNGNGIPDECEVNPCPADTNGDNVIDVTDLLNLLAAWGSCF